MLHLRPVVATAASERPLAAGPSTCIVTGFWLVATDLDGAALQFLPQGGRDGCMGAYPFLGVRAERLGASARTHDDFAELAQALRRWTPADGVPALDHWVQLAPALMPGLRSAGIDPVRLLQWWNGSAPAVAGSAQVSGDRAWPVFLPRGRVADPARIVAAPPLPALLPPVSAPPQVRPAPMAAPPRPPAVVTWQGRAVPCAVAPSCRPAWIRWRSWRALPWWRRWVGRAWGWRWAGLALMVTALGALVWNGRHRSRVWEVG